MSKPARSCDSHIYNDGARNIAPLRGAGRPSLDAYKHLTPDGVSDRGRLRPTNIQLLTELRPVASLSVPINQGSALEQTQRENLTRTPSNRL